MALSDVTLKAKAHKDESGTAHVEVVYVDEGNVASVWQGRD
jgi:hypothetical protein